MSSGCLLEHIRYLVPSHCHSDSNKLTKNSMPGFKPLQSCIHSCNAIRRFTRRIKWVRPASFKSHAEAGTGNEDRPLPWMLDEVETQEYAKDMFPVQGSSGPVWSHRHRIGSVRLPWNYKEGSFRGYIDTPGAKDVGAIRGQGYRIQHKYQEDRINAAKLFRSRNSGKWDRESQQFDCRLLPVDDEEDKPWQQKWKTVMARMSSKDVDKDNDDHEDEGEDEDDNEGNKWVRSNSVNEYNEQMEYSREEWKRRRMGWLCREIPASRAREIVKLLNSQSRWMRNEDVKYVVEYLMKFKHLLRAHRVLKWSQQRPWYELDFNLASELAEKMAYEGKLTRARDLFDTIIIYARVPRASTFTALIKAYLVDGKVNSVESALMTYNRMIQLGNYEPNSTIKYSLYKALTENTTKSLHWLDKSEALFQSIGESGLPRTTEMYEALVWIHAVKGDEARVDSLVQEMSTQGLDLSPKIFGSIVRVCAKTGNYMKAEQAFKKIVLLAGEIDWHYYVALIKTYGMAGLTTKALQVFNDMENSVSNPKFHAYQAIVEVMAEADELEKVDSLLDKLEKFDCSSVQSAFNSVMDMYVRAHLYDKVEETFGRMKPSGCNPTCSSYNFLIKSSVEKGDLEKATEIFNRVIAGDIVNADRDTFNIMIEAYGRAELLPQVKKVFEELTERRFAVREELAHYVNAAVSPGKMKHLERKLAPDLERPHREILVGVLLGGAGIESHDKNRTYEIHFELDSTTSRNQILLNHLYELFLGWAADSPKVKFVENNTQPQRECLHFSTMSNPKFRFYAHQYRPDDKPVIPRLIHRWLSPRSLAYWYMYGGKRCPVTGGIILNAHSYTKNHLLLVIEALKNKSINSFIRKGTAGPVIRVHGDSAIWLWKLMEPHILPELVTDLRPDKSLQNDKNIIPQLTTIKAILDDEFEEKEIVNNSLRN